jgi:hypothetical protein
MKPHPATLVVMPAGVLISVVALGATGLGLLILGLATLIFGESLLLAAGGVLGTAECIVTGRLVERRSSARIAAITLALVQAVGGVIAVANGQPLGLSLIGLAGIVIIPLSTQSAEDYFEAAPE